MNVKFPMLVDHYDWKFNVRKGKVNNYAQTQFPVTPVNFPGIAGLKSYTMKNIAQVVIGLPVRGPFDYSVPHAFQENITQGQRVYVPFGKRRLVGFIVGFRKQSFFGKLKPILDVLDNAPVLSDAALEGTKEFARYYMCSWGEAIETSLPTGLRKKNSLAISLPEAPAQTPGQGETFLCHDQGQTGRWTFLIEKIQKALSDGKGVIFLVPEVSYIPQVQDTLRTKLNVEPAVLDKRLTAKKELEEWLAVKEGRRRVVVGTRSAVFAPMPQLGLIVMFDEENPAYKQEQSPFYQTREVIRMRSALEGSSVIFVSSAPSAEVWHQMRLFKENVVSFEPDHLSEMRVIDLSNYKRRSQTVISFPLQSQIQKTLAENGKVVLFLNRRGFSTATQCNSCGFTVKCPRCDVRLSYLYSKKKMVCHLCNHMIDLPKVCPHCQKDYLRSTGIGIEKLESEVSRLWPQTRVARFDRETIQAPSSANVVMATQAVLKVLKELQPTLIGVLDIDAELNRVDFRAAQKVFSLLVHLRQAAKEFVFVQTFQPDNYGLRAAAKMDFKRFYKKELSLRKELGFPPFQHLVAVGLRGQKEEVVFEQAQAFFAELQKDKSERIEIMDPQPDVVPKLRDKYRFTIMLKGKSVAAVDGAVKKAGTAVKRKKDVIMTVNVDP